MASSPKLRGLDLGKPEKLTLDKNYNRYCDFYVEKSVRDEINKESLLFATIISTLVTLNEYALRNDPERHWEGLGYHEGGIRFKNADVTFQNNGVRVKKDELPIKEQNLIYPVITATMINRVCSFYTSFESGSVKDRLFRCAELCVDSQKVCMNDILQEINENIFRRSFDYWRGFFED